MDRIGKIDCHRTDDDADKIRIDEVIAQPADALNEDWVQKEIIKRTNCQPGKREDRANDALDVTPSIGIIPKLDLEAFDED